MTIGLSDTLTFGKHKGSKVGEVLVRDAGWLCWLREAKREEGKPRIFDDETNKRVDEAIIGSRSLQKSYKPWGDKPAFDVRNALKGAAEADAARVEKQEEMAMAYEGMWGSWS